MFLTRARAHAAAAAIMCAAAGFAAFAPTGNGQDVAPADTHRYTAVIDGRAVPVTVHSHAARARAVVASHDLGDAAPWLAASFCGDQQTADLRAGDNGKRIKAVYAIPADGTDRFAEIAPLMQAAAKGAAGTVAQASGGQRSLNFDTGSSCGEQYLDIMTVRLAQTGAQLAADEDQAMTAIAAQVRSAFGAQQSAFNYIVWADVPGNRHEFIGKGELTFTDRPDGGAVSFGGLVGVVFAGPGTVYTNHGLLTMTMLHEITHTLGAVQDSAPHSTGAGHCNDGNDVMCYRDGGPRDTMTFPCPSANRLVPTPDAYDCGRDDYFDPSPAPGSYLDTHFNVFNSVFLCRPDQCGVALPSPNVTITAGKRAKSRLPVTASVTGVPSAEIAWDLDGDGAHDDAIGAQATIRLGRVTGPHVAAIARADNGTTAAATLPLNVVSLRATPKTQAVGVARSEGLQVALTSNRPGPIEVTVRQHGTTVGRGTMSASGPIVSPYRMQIRTSAAAGKVTVTAKRKGAPRATRIVALG